MPPSLNCPVCELALPSGTDVCPRDGTVVDRTRPSVDPLIGAKLGEYVVAERIGMGGMGIVYRGEHPVIGKQVAIKVLRPDVARDQEQAQRLLDEARAVSSVGHRGIVDVFGFGEVPDGRHYLVMEFLRGEALDQALSRGRMSLPRALEILEDVCQALAAVHARAIVHRDLKPSNVFLMQQPDGAVVVKLLDFGLAKRSRERGMPTPQTSELRVVGTPEYLAPEQARALPVGDRTDLYSLGVMAFQLVTGELPFSGPTPMDVATHHVMTPAPRASSFVPQLPARLDALLASLLEKEPEARPASALEVKAVLGQVRRSLSQQSTARLSTGELALSLERAQGARREPRRAAWAAGAAVVAIAAATVLWGRDPTPRATAPAPASPPGPEAVAPVVAQPEPPPPLAPAPAPAPAEPPGSPAAPPAPAARLSRTPRVQSSQELLSRLEDLKKRAEAASVEAAMLNRLKQKRLLLLGQHSAADRREIAKYLDDFERAYLR